MLGLGLDRLDDGGEVEERAGTDCDPFDLPYGSHSDHSIEPGEERIQKDIYLYS